MGGVQRRLEEVTKRNPKTIVLMVGINDVAAGSSSSEIIEKAMQVIERIETELPDTRIVLCDTLPSLRYPLSVIEKVNRGYASLSDIYTNITYLPLMELYMNSDGTVNAELFSNDNVHLNGSGYSVWLNELRNIFSEQN